MTQPQDLLDNYDHQLRLDAEAQGALASRRFSVNLGQDAEGEPVQVDGVVCIFDGDFGFISTGHVGRAALTHDGAPVTVEPLVTEGLAQVLGLAAETLQDGQVLTAVEFKTRSHDVLPGLAEALTAAGFAEGESESIMVGTAQSLAADVVLPEGVTLHRITEFADLLEMAQAAGVAFGDDPEEAEGHARDVQGRLAQGTGAEAWVARANGQVVSGGRIEPVPGTKFAGIWGGFTLRQWRGQGIYRALTAARAESAIRQGIEFINSDCTEDSRPILARYGFTKVAETTPWEKDF